ncbi:NAD(P)/FAD-dependent oxidoreductase [Streptomyces sp. NBC_00859]|uniref:NAD(P)/FAD-dependent oxidoreductase n=1 Tax=Streptomyces sp. NBC_00859 TaxID=2903682 RepID=UPI003869CE5C|nr:FAD-dependent oxidoreductase [Streptomyces sp. NBC_00859]
MHKDEDIVVIGCGTAGSRLARQLGAGARVTVLGEEVHAPYNRVLLTDVLAGRCDPGDIALPSAGERRGVRAVRIDRAERVVRCDDGGAVPYGTLVLATGSNPVMPPLRGFDGELPDGVHPFRTLDDALALGSAVCGSTRAVVVGGGLLGVSAARALAGRGARVVLVQQGEYLMARHLDARAGELLCGHLEALGVEVHTGCRMRGLRGRDVELADGYVLESDLTVLACGVRPRTGLARAAGLAVRHGIVVDDGLRTSDPAIRAIGDCAEHRGQVYGLAGPAVEQADVLAAQLTGSPAAYTGTRALTRLTLPGAAPLDLAAFGEPTPLPGDDVVRLADATRGAYRTAVVRGDRLVGGVLLGDLSAVGELARTWEGDEPLPSTPLFHLLGGY